MYILKGPDWISFFKTIHELSREETLRIDSLQDSNVHLQQNNLIISDHIYSECVYARQIVSSTLKFIYRTL